MSSTWPNEQEHTSKLRFGAFAAPFHAHAGQNPTLALQRDLELAQLLERLGYDEVWFGEHHSGGAELITSPELFCAWVAAQTSRIKVGTGVVSLPYHNPLWVADRAILLDHLSRGRFMLGIGPGILATDAHMVGLDPAELRNHLQEDFPVLMHLLRSDEPISIDTGRYKLQDARCQLDRYSDFDVAVASIFTPSGPLLAGRYGIGLLQLSGLTPEGMAVLPKHWDVVEKAAADHGTSPKPEDWRVVGIMHIAESRDQAIEDVRFGLSEYFDYVQNTMGSAGYAAAGSTFDSRLEWAMSTGNALIGTPDDAIAKLGELVDASGGRVGAFLFWAQEWASPAATNRSYELFARHVMPRFQGTTGRLAASRAAVADASPRLTARQTEGALRFIEATKDRTG
ncbi:MAG TPA: LLM class flavin-dependent oxidoreductase [Acidimicrobiales bacterium]|nr:LLM class flavin-dependent oxidoreductase [Acidimicrobiales bacterium]